MQPIISHPNLIAELKALGAVKYNLLLPETHAIPNEVKPDEIILGVVYGRYKQESDNTISRGVLIATDQRVLLLNKKFMFKQSDEIIYRIISGVSYTRIAFMGTVTLHTRIGDINMRTFNSKCAHIFVEAIESKIFNSSVNVPL